MRASWGSATGALSVSFGVLTSSAAKCEFRPSVVAKECRRSDLEITRQECDECRRTTLLIDELNLVCFLGYFKDLDDGSYVAAVRPRRRQVAGQSYDVKQGSHSLYLTELHHIDGRQPRND
jgi:hypothetical protein